MCSLSHMIFPLSRPGACRITNMLLQDQDASGSREVGNQPSGKQWLGCPRSRPCSYLCQKSLLCFLITANQLLHHHHLPCCFVSHLLGDRYCFCRKKTRDCGDLMLSCTASQTTGAQGYRTEVGRWREEAIQAGSKELWELL